jgi:hypothetical protein
MNLAMLQSDRAHLAPPQTEAVEKLLRDVGLHFADLGAGGSRQPGDALLADLDHTIAELVVGPEAGARPGVTALVGLRRNLFAGAPPFRPLAESEA